MHRILSLPAFFIFLLAAIGIYALAGSPTPDQPGTVEIAVGLLLVLSVITAGFYKSLSFFRQRNFFLLSVQVVFFSGIIFPTIAGVYFGNNHTLILRDVIAFAFLGLPLFFAEKIGEHKDTSNILLGAIVFAGLAFAIRTLVPVFNIWIPQGELTYLSNSPLTLFAAIFMAGSLFISLQDVREKGMIRPILCLCALGTLLAAMLLDVQRATVGAVILSMLILALAIIIKTPRKAVIPLLVLIGLCVAIYPLIGDAVQAMAQKTAAVGVNMRVAEAEAVYRQLISKPETLIIGYGWGASFASPAVGGMEVNYTHSLLTMMALKGGIIMLGAVILLSLSALHQIFLIFQRDKLVALSLFWALLVPVLLYASHKSLDFGLVLLMIGVWSIRGQTLHPRRSSDKNSAVT